MSDAFYIPQGEGEFFSSELTRGPWGGDFQHAGPPAALIGRAIEAASERDDMQVTRATFEILRPIPIAPLTVTASVVRPGKSVELVEATLMSGGETIISARAWRIRTTELDLDPLGTSPPRLPLPGPKDFTGVFETGHADDYLHAMEWRFVDGDFLEAGPAAAWARMRYPLVAGEEISPLSRVLILADSGNGISSELDFTKWLFINADLTVYLHRLPAGEWVCLDAATIIEPAGIGLAHSILSDENGVIGRGLQSLFVAPRT